MSYPTTRTHPRTLAQAFGDPYSIECPKGYRMGLRIKTKPSRSDVAREFLVLLWQYRTHGPIYATRQAWRIAVQGLPF
jgi:hypothetical protein